MASPPGVSTATDVPSAPPPTGASRRLYMQVAAVEAGKQDVARSGRHQIEVARLGAVTAAAALTSKPDPLPIRYSHAGIGTSIVCDKPLAARDRATDRRVP